MLLALCCGLLEAEFVINGVNEKLLETILASFAEISSSNHPGKDFSFIYFICLFFTFLDYSSPSKRDLYII